MAKEPAGIVSINNAWLKRPLQSGLGLFAGLKERGRAAGKRGEPTAAKA
jgi:hypothetical protein